jgi:hypothetical protein
MLHFLQDLPGLLPLGLSMPKHGLPLLHNGSKLSRLTQLSSLSLIRQQIDLQDWQALLGLGSRLTVGAVPP